jgi:hypothetical protein
MDRGYIKKPCELKSPTTAMEADCYYLSAVLSGLALVPRFIGLAAFRLWRWSFLFARYEILIVRHYCHLLHIILLFFTRYYATSYRIV